MQSLPSAFERRTGAPFPAVVLKRGAGIITVAEMKGCCKSPDTVWKISAVHDFFRSFFPLAALCVAQRSAALSRLLFPPKVNGLMWSA